VLIDWFTVIAQIVNFVVLVLLLKYFLYDRIIEAMDRREEKIRKRLEEADSKRKEAEQEAEFYRRKNEEIDRKGDEMLSKAKQEAEQERKSLTKKAREEVEEIRDKWHQSVLNEQNAFLRDLRELAANQVYAISRRALQDLADVKLEQRLVEVFLSEIQNMSKEKRHKITETIKSQEYAVTVKSSFKLPAKFRRKVTETVRRSLTKNAELNYEIDSDIIMGIELKSGGEKVAWNLENYLNSLEQHAKEALERERQN
jgi:F-type H+-transporting ATPase subunit b